MVVINMDLTQGMLSFMLNDYKLLHIQCKWHAFMNIQCNATARAIPIISDYLIFVNFNFTIDDSVIVLCFINTNNMWLILRCKILNSSM